MTFVECLKLINQKIDLDVIRTKDGYTLIKTTIMDQYENKIEMAKKLMTDPDARNKLKNEIEQEQIKRSGRVLNCIVRDTLKDNARRKKRDH